MLSFNLINIKDFFKGIPESYSNYKRDIRNKKILKKIKKEFFNMDIFLNNDCDDSCYKMIFATEKIALNFNGNTDSISSIIDRLEKLKCIKKIRIVGEIPFYDLGVERVYLSLNVEGKQLIKNLTLYHILDKDYFIKCLNRLN